MRKKDIKIFLATALLVFLVAAWPWPFAAMATQGHVFAKGTVYNAATYIGHSKFGTHPSYYGNSPEQVVDINIGWGSWDDEGTPLFAPEDGTARMIHNNTDSWGYSLEWRNMAGTERLFLAHLRSVLQAGPVRAGEQLAEIGGTGGWNPHLHIESASGWVVLSGEELRPPVNPRGQGMLYASEGPVSPSAEVKSPPPAVITIRVDENTQIVPAKAREAAMRPASQP